MKKPEKEFLNEFTEAMHTTFTLDKAKSITGKAASYLAGTPAEINKELNNRRKAKNEIIKLKKVQKL